MFPDDFNEEDKGFNFEDPKRPQQKGNKQTSSSSKQQQKD